MSQIVSAYHEATVWHPNSGRSYEDCEAAYQALLDAIDALIDERDSVSPGGSKVLIERSEIEHLREGLKHGWLTDARETVARWLHPSPAGSKQK